MLEVIIKDFFCQVFSAYVAQWNFCAKLMWQNQEKVSFCRRLMSTSRTSATYMCSPNYDRPESASESLCIPFKIIFTGDFSLNSSWVNSCWHSFWAKGACVELHVRSHSLSEHRGESTSTWYDTIPYDTIRYVFSVCSDWMTRRGPEQFNLAGKTGTQLHFLGVLIRLWKGFKVFKKSSFSWTNDILISSDIT